MRTKRLVAVFCVLWVGAGIQESRAEDPSWESLGPGLGFYQYDDFFVTENALYVGQSVDWDTGLGLYRKRFDEEEWELIAFEDYKIRGITVWGEDDENLLIRRWSGEGPSTTWRSTDEGMSWAQTENPPPYQPALQSPDDPDRMISAPYFSTDGGWTWQESNLGWWFSGHSQAFDPNDGMVAYYATHLSDESYRIYKTTTGGASWSEAGIFPSLLGLDVEGHNGNHVLASPYFISSSVWVSTDAGQSWTWTPAPFRPGVVTSPPWAARTFFAAGSSTDGMVYEMWLTHDLGETWTSFSDSLPPLPGEYWESWMRIQAHPVEPILYVALEPTGVWRLDLSGVSGVDDVRPVGPVERLAAYPNPSSGAVTIAFREEGAPMLRSIRVVDVMGRVVRTLQAGSDQATLRWDGRDRQGRDAASGVYRIVELRPDGHVGGSQQVLILR